MANTCFNESEKLPVPTLMDKLYNIKKEHNKCAELNNLNIMLKIEILIPVGSVFKWLDTRGNCIISEYSKTGCSVYNTSERRCVSFGIKQLLMIKKIDSKIDPEWFKQFKLIL